MHLWESHIGKAAITKTASMYDWNKLARSVGQRATDGYRSTRRTQPVKRTEPSNAKRHPIPSTIRVPVSVLLSQWNEGTATKRIDSEEAKEVMRKVDTATKDLRKCFTEMAVQKGCIQVALALVELVAKGVCYNPFLCLQQAAIFASQGYKGGTSDEAFKEGLPKERECTPLEALVIIGRADCLQSLHFPDEAIYLCSYVARVCRLHRDKLETELEWNALWKVVGICLYNLSVAIRTTRSFQDDENCPEYWEETVVEELKRGRVDAMALKGSLAETEVLMEIDHVEDSESNEEDNFDDNGQVGDDQEPHVDDGCPEGEVEVMESDGPFAFQPTAMLSATSGGMLQSDDEEREIVAV